MRAFNCSISAASEAVPLAGAIYGSTAITAGSTAVATRTAVIIVAIRVLIAAHPFGWIHHVAHIERMGCTGK